MTSPLLIAIIKTYYYFATLQDYIDPVNASKMFDSFKIINAFNDIPKHPNLAVRLFDAPDFAHS